jgi:hypothetical protein
VAGFDEHVHQFAAVASSPFELTTDNWKLLPYVAVIA